jgi:cell division protein FtsW
MLLAVAALLGFGLLMVYSASWQPSMLREENPAYYFINQIKWAILGAIAGAVVMYIDYRRWKKLVVLMMICMIALLLAVLIFGESRYGSKRTLFNGSIQPSELAKLAIIIYLSFWLYSKQDVLNNIHFGLIPMTFILGSTAGLIFLQPDLSATLTILMLGGLLFFLAGVDLRQIMLIMLGVLAIGAIFVAVSNTGQARITQYIAGLRDPVSASYHIKRSIESIVNGGLFGVGIGRGSSKYGLPVSHTDSIFAVIAEETGLFGAGLVILLNIIIMWRGLVIASRAKDLLGKLLAAGLTLWISVEATLNMGVMVNLFPFAGNALPLVSAGGSSMTMTMIAIGLIMSVARTSAREDFKKEGKTYGAVVNLRRGNRRGRVSSSHRSRGTRR